MVRFHVRPQNLMITEEAYISVQRMGIQKPIDAYVEICENTDPRPIYCELPDNLKVINHSGSETVQYYTLASSFASLPSLGTTTTLPLDS